jgi:RecQ zinc-binding
MVRFAERSGCRMSALVHHFGDGSENAFRCERCDSCDPGGCIAREFREPSGEELTLATALVGS